MRISNSSPRAFFALLNRLQAWYACVILLTLVSCQPHAGKPVPPLSSGIQLRPIDLDNSLIPAETTGTISLTSAKNEWISFTIQIQNIPAGNTGLALRIDPLRGNSNLQIAPSNYSVFQVLMMPLDTNKAGFMRQTGTATGQRQLPRALLPIPTVNGKVNLSSLRDPSHPFDPASHAGPGSKVLLWIDLHIPSDAKAGDYTTRCEVVSGMAVDASPALPVTVHVYDFEIPKQQHLVMASQLNWEDLERLYPDRFEAITPRLMNRSNPIYGAPIHTIDDFVSLAQQNRADIVVPRLQPTVKWPAGQPPQVDWSDFDTLVSPWLNGDAFADKAPLGYWPIPGVDYLENYDAKSQRDYWSNASTHFNRQDWLNRSFIVLRKQTPGRATALESIQLSMQARQLLEAHPLVRVAVPLEDDQLQFVSSDNAFLLDPATTSRLISTATGLVFDAPSENWPEELRRPEHWMRTDLQGLVPFVGAGGTERDVRLWAWLAFLKHADLITWPSALPEENDPTQQADPSKMILFYPGNWFGVDQPVPSIQLKWLRRAQQDYEYLELASLRGMQTDAFLLARLITKQVELQPVQSPDPEYGLLTGTVDQKTWDEAHDLLARIILLRKPGISPDGPLVKSEEARLDLDIVRWQQPRERPYVLPRAAQWLWDNPTHSNGDKWALVRLGVDIYNAGDNRPDANQLQWARAGDAWEFKPNPIIIGALKTYWIQRFSLDARVDLDHVTPDSRVPLEIRFTDGYTRNSYPTQLALPVAVSDRREGNLRIDGKLPDWTDDDLIHDGRLTKMLNRNSVQNWQIEPSSVESKIYSCWADEAFYVAFRLHGVSPEQKLHRNFVDYEFRRAWGEDLCELMIQPIFDDNSVGPVTYIACKPNGVCMVKRRLDPKTNSDPWRETDGTAVRYAAEPDQDHWSGEVAIPWKLLLGDNTTNRPRIVRFNFIQHLQSTGESASWAGPIDHDLDDSFMGLIYLREFNAPQMKP